MMRTTTIKHEKKFYISLNLSQPTKAVLGMKILALFLFQMTFPTVAMALSGGPSQPEVQSFEPVGTSEMVDPFSGDFSYNIPLLDVEGYPINISYHSGITMDQEASWVGLGWNINAGVVNRNMRGLPDDFDGDEVQKIFHVEKNKTWGLTLGANFSLEAVGFQFLGDEPSASLGVSLGLKYNNYNGYTASIGLTPGLSAGDDAKMPLNASLGISASSDAGAALNPSVGMEFNKYKESSSVNDSKMSSSINVGGSFSSRGGLKALSVEGTLPKSNELVCQNKVDKKKTDGVGVGTSWNFGGYTYAPTGEMNYRNFSFSGRFSGGAEVAPGFTGGNISGYFSRQELESTHVNNKAYGYLNAHKATDPKALLDYNRENDGAVSEKSPAIALTSFTYDLFSVSGQGAGGSFRSMRSDVGMVGNVYNQASPAENVSAELELGFPAVAKIGGSLGYSRTTTTSGPWQQNAASSKFKFKGPTKGSMYEPYYFKEANDKTVDPNPTLFNELGGYEAVRIKLSGSGNSVTASNKLITASGNTKTVNSNFFAKRSKRNSLFYFLKVEHVDDYGVGGFSSHLAPNGQGQNVQTLSTMPGHHMGEITTLGSDGARYIYGLPAYNWSQREFTFAVGRTADNQGPVNYNKANGQVTYADSDMSTDNQKGIDEFFSETRTPSYAHSFLLTSVLSSDYVDSDNVRGPSDNDLGSYTKFQYDVVKGYKWRTPFTGNSANYNGGLNSDHKDDKASVVYGEKDLFYLKQVVTKNYIAIFNCSARNDGRGVVDEHGGINTNNAQAMRKLDRIDLYSKKDFENFSDANGDGIDDNGDCVPIKSVHFEYDYTLCDGIENSINGGGKLTLKKLYFTYQNSARGQYNAYHFDYSDFNPNYNLKGYDRWSNFKPNNVSANYTMMSAEWPNSDYPYTTQDKTQADLYAGAWTLNKIDLPSGGSIVVEYEADTYSHVQHLDACKMVPIIGEKADNEDVNTFPSPSFMTISNNGFVDNDKNRALVFEMEPGTQPEDYLKPGDQVFYKCAVPFVPFSPPGIDGDPAFTNALQGMCKYEYVSGYADVDSVDSEGNKCFVKLKGAGFRDDSDGNFNPITKSTIEFARRNLPKLINDFPAGEDDNLKNALVAIANALGSVKELFKNPYKYVYRKGIGKTIVSHKSMIRVKVPNQRKFGGGARVKRIVSRDNWNEMVGGQNETREYGQEYKYEDDQGRSWGVASYEPQIGGEENPWKKGDYFAEDRKGFPDERFLAEEPFGETFFPSPSVGYRKVEVTSLKYESAPLPAEQRSITRHGTGKVVHEFYTAKEFPTLVQKTDIDRPRYKTPAASLSSVLKLDVKDYMTVTQGFVIENNDMHGKPKAQYVYAEGQVAPISSVVYNYKMTSMTLDGKPVNRLVNECKVIEPNGQVNPNARLGVFYDVIHDSREQRTFNESYELRVNADVTVFFGITLPSAWPHINTETSRFRSISTTKVIQRFGILDETIATQDGSVVSTKNEAYDAETGQALLTRTVTDYDDAIYTLNYPAYWYYKEMGPAYKNIGFQNDLQFDGAGIAPVVNARSKYAEGDELAIVGGVRGWIIEVDDYSVKVVNKQGEPISADVGTGTLATKVIRSGYRNMQMGSAASITTLSNPLDGLNSNVYSKVLQASAIEYTNSWPTVCDCFDTDELPLTANPYVLGVKGYWKPTKSYLHLSGRTQSNINGNTNLREDGVFTSYNPFYKLNSNGSWEKDYQNWTYTSEVTMFSPFGQELENRDALGRYSAATFGFNQTLPTAVAANAQYNEIGFESFEDRNPNGTASCSDSKFKIPILDNMLTDTDAHTGKFSILVDLTRTATLTSNPPVPCFDGSCALAAVYEPQNSNFGSIYIQGGSGGYNVTWQAQLGYPNVVGQYDSNGYYRLDVTGQNWMLLVNCTDSDGNTISQIIQYSPQP